MKTRLLSPAFAPRRVVGLCVAALAFLGSSQALAKAASGQTLSTDPHSADSPKGEIVYCQSTSNPDAIVGVRTEPSGFPAQCPSGYQPFEASDVDLDRLGAESPTADDFATLPDRHTSL